jgi:hypothetical protein
VCTRTGFATVFQCAEPPPGSKAGVTAAVKVGTITAGVTQEVH